MSLHIIKLCVGCDSLAELADWQKKRLKEKRAARSAGSLEVPQQA